MLVQTLKYLCLRTLCDNPGQINCTLLTGDLINDVLESIRNPDHLKTVETVSCRYVYKFKELIKYVAQHHFDHPLCKATIDDGLAERLYEDNRWYETNFEDVFTAVGSYVDFKPICVYYNQKINRFIEFDYDYDYTDFVRVDKNWLRKKYPWLGRVKSIAFKKVGLFKTTYFEQFDDLSDHAEELGIISPVLDIPVDYIS